MQLALQVLTLARQVVTFVQETDTVKVAPPGAAAARVMHVTTWAMKHPIAVKDSFATQNKWFGCMLSAVDAQNVGANIKYHLQAATCAVYLAKWIFFDRNVSANAQLKLFPANG